MAGLKADKRARLLIEGFRFFDAPGIRPMDNIPERPSVFTAENRHVRGRVWTQGFYIPGIYSAGSEQGLHIFPERFKPVFGVLLNPAGARIIAGVFGQGSTGYVTAFVQQGCLACAAAKIHAKNVLHYYLL
jgi:hypothetical protein